MFYATWSEGFRPGGMNRRGTFPPYKADFLTNYEIGWKTTLGRQPPALQRRGLQGRLGRLPVFVPRRQRPDRDPQRRPGANQGHRDRHRCGRSPTTLRCRMRVSFSMRSRRRTIAARRTTRAERRWVRPLRAPTSALRHPVATADRMRPFQFVRPRRARNCPCSRSSRRNIVARNEFELGDFKAHTCRAPSVYQGSAWTDLRTAERELSANSLRTHRSISAAGIENDSWGLELFVKNVFDERAEVARYTECGSFSLARRCPIGSAVRPAALYRHQYAAHDGPDVHQEVLKIVSSPGMPRASRGCSRRRLTR